MPPSTVTTSAAAVLCHPHPQYGGNRFDRVVTALFDALPSAGCAALRFDFRSTFGGGTSERLDIAAALDELDKDTGLTGLPRLVVGYSFGAVVALSTHDRRISAVAAIAPPLGHGADPAPEVPVLVVCPRHDQFCPPTDLADRTRSWTDVETVVVESADHFLAGHAAAVAAIVIDRLLARRLFDRAAN